MDVHLGTAVLGMGRPDNLRPQDGSHKGLKLTEIIALCGPRTASRRPDFPQVPEVSMRHHAHPTINNHNEPSPHAVEGSPRPAAYWVDRASPPGYNVATRQVIREASLAPFHRAVAARLTRLRRRLAIAPSRPASKEAVLSQVHGIEEQARGADATGS